MINASKGVEEYKNIGIVLRRVSCGTNLHLVLAKSPLKVEGPIQGGG